MSQNLVESKPPDEHTALTQNKRDSNDLDPPKLFQKHHAELKTPKRLMIPNHENSAPKSPFNRLRRLSKAEFPAFGKVGLKRMKPVGHLDYNQIVHRFERQSTFHGICHAATAPDKKSRHFWHLAFAICLALLLLQIFWVFQRYREYAKTVDLDLKFENAPFPSVTLCNLNPYKASAISSDAATKKTMEAFMNIMKSGGRTEGVAASIAHLGNPRQKRELSDDLGGKKRRYHQVYAQCYCEINRLSGERKKGSCFAAYKGTISLNFADASNLNNFHPSKCLCQLDWISKTLWPCFPYNTWKERLCKECSKDLGHCPMKFYEGSQERPNLSKLAKVCLCHKDYNHCIANNENDMIPEIFPTEDLAQINFTKSFEQGSPNQRTTTTTTTQAPEIVQAMGFTDLKDEIAISTQAQQNLMFTVGEKNITEKINLSQQKDELILKCSFNQKDCDIESDFLLHYDPTYGNCFTFNWNRTKPLGAHRAGANYGLRVLLYANVSEYLPTSEAVGFRITIHDKWISPFPDAFGYSAPTGFMSSFGVRMKQFYRISPPHGHCLDGGEDSEFYIYKGFNYNVEGCHRSCTQHEVIRTCKCADPMYPIPKNATPCSVNDPIARDCIKNTTQYLGSLIAEGKLANCDCHQPCNEIGYEVSYSAARWPSGTTKLMECEPNDDLCMEKYRKNAAMIQVFYEELNYETLTESPAYTWMMVLADLGGLTGLWIGASVVSTLELVMLAVYTFQAYKKKRKESSATAYSIRPPLLKQKSTTLSNPSINHRRKTSSLDSKPSLIDRIEVPAVPQLVIESDEDSDSQLERYLPPGADLPCECLYGADGRIVRMKPLCPEHGYLVRRGEQLLPDEEDGAYDDSEAYTSVEIEQEA